MLTTLGFGRCGPQRQRKIGMMQWVGQRIFHYRSSTGMVDAPAHHRNNGYFQMTCSLVTKSSSRMSSGAIDLATADTVWSKRVVCLEGCM